MYIFWKYHFVCRYSVLVLFILIANGCFAQSNDNLLKNYSFETTQLFYDNIFPGWLCHNNENVVRSSEHVYEGKYSAKMSSRESGNTAIVNQVIDVIPNSKIRIRHHYYITQWKDKGARMYCYFRERQAESSTLPNDYLSSYYDTKTLRIIRGGGYGLTYFPHELNKWLTFDEVITVPPDAHNFVFEIHSFYGTTIYVDDCYVGQETPSVITNVNANNTDAPAYDLTGRKVNSNYRGIIIKDGNKMIMR